MSQKLELMSIPDDGIVERDGAYSISIERYHEQCCKLPSLSSSGIRKIVQQSPAAFWKDSLINPNCVANESTTALNLGQAAHTLLLGEDGFDEQFVVQPIKAPDGTAWNNNKTICKEWKAEQAKNGKTVLTSAQIEQIRGMAGLLPWQKGMDGCGLLNTSIVQSGLLSGEIEVSLFFEQDGLFLKSRPDVIPNASGDFVDLKTISPRNEDGMSYANLAAEVYRRGYFVQGALVGMACGAVLGMEMESFNIVFVDTGNVHDVAVYSLDEQDLLRGEQAIFSAIKTFNHCMETGSWPGRHGRSTDAQKLVLPTWARESFDRKLENIEQEYAA